MFRLLEVFALESCSSPSVIRIMQLWIYGDEGDGEEHPFSTAGQHSFWGSCSHSAAVDSDRASAETSPWL